MAAVSGIRFRWAAGAVATALLASVLVTTPSDADVTAGAPRAGSSTDLPTASPLAPPTSSVAALAAAAPATKVLKLGRYRPVAGHTVLDTRTGLGAAKKRVAKKSVAVKVAGVGGVATGAYAVAVDLTASSVTKTGSVTVYADGAGRPKAPMLTASKGDTVSGHTQVQVGANGKIRLYGSGSSHLRVVVVGWYVRSNRPGVAPAAGNRLVAVKAVRVLRAQKSKVLTAKHARRVVVAGSGGVPASAAAVVINLTVSKATASTNLTLYAGGASRGPASLAVKKGRRASLLTVVPVGARAINVYSSAGRVVATLDVVGYYRSGTVADPGQFVALTPATLATKTVKKRQKLTVTVLGKKGTAVRGVARALVRVTVSGSTKAGSATAYPTGGARSSISSLTYAKKRTASNLALVKPGTGGRITVYTTQKARVRVDVVGWFTARTATAPKALGTKVKAPPVGRAAAADAPGRVVDGDVVRTTTTKSVKELASFWTAKRRALASGHGMSLLERPTPAADGPAMYAGSQKAFPIYTQGYESVDQYAAAAGRLLFYDPAQGNYSNCSGTMVARNLVMTAAHCVVNPNGTDHTNFVFIPKQMGTTAPYGNWYGTGAVYYTYYTDTTNRLDVGSPFFAADYALITFAPQNGGIYPQNYYPGDVTSWFPIMWDTPNGNAWMAGYPSEGSYFSKNCTHGSETVNNCWAYYCWAPTSDYVKHYDGWYEQGMGCNGSGGISGGPVFQYVDGTWYLVSVVSNGPSVFDPDGVQRRYAINLWGPYFNDFVGRLWNSYVVR